MCSHERTSRINYYLQRCVQSIGVDLRDCVGGAGQQRARRRRRRLRRRRLRLLLTRVRRRRRRCRGAWRRVARQVTRGAVDSLEQQQQFAELQQRATHVEPVDNARLTRLRVHLENLRAMCDE